jgi:hypothetical protein
MRKTLAIAGLLALLVIPFMVIGAGANNVCPEGNGWSDHQEPPLSEVQGAVEYCVKGGSVDNGEDVSFTADGCVGYLDTGSFQEVSATVRGDNACGLSHWSYRLGDPTATPVTPTRVPPTATPEPITLEVSCAGWRVKQGGETIEGAAWEDPYSLEVHFSQVLDQRIREPEECLKERGDPTLRIGGRCTEDGDSQEIGYVFNDGDYDGARLIITRQDGVEVANVGEGSDFFPARAALYGWKIMWFNGETREELDAGRFEVDKCDLPEPTPEPTDKPKDPPETGGGGSVLAADRCWMIQSC